MHWRHKWIITEVRKMSKKFIVDTFAILRDFLEEADMDKETDREKFKELIHYSENQLRYASQLETLAYTAGLGVEAEPGGLEDMLFNFAPDPTPVMINFSKKEESCDDKT